MDQVEAPCECNPGAGLIGPHKVMQDLGGDFIKTLHAQ